MTKTMRNLFRAILLIATVISLLFVPWPIVTLWLSPLPDSIQIQAEDALDYGFDGIVIYVGGPAEQEHYYTAGWHDREAEIPARPDAIFKIASISKLYVASAIAKLINEDKLSADDTLVHWFPELAVKVPYAEEITVKMMIQHRSGLFNFTDIPGYWEQPDRTYEQNIAILIEKPASFVPDTDYEYSNSNYMLLWQLIGRASEQTPESYIRSRILTPHNLTQTWFSLDEVDMDNLMGGYYEGVEVDIKSNNYGSMLATTGDVGRFVRALNTGNLFNHPEAQQNYLYEYEHGGLIPGYQSHARYYPETDTVVVMVINTTDFNGYDWNLSQILFNRISEIIKRHESGE